VSLAVGLLNLRRPAVSLKYHRGRYRRSRFAIQFWWVWSPERISIYLFVVKVTNLT